jgi:hypothetical protein
VGRISSGLKRAVLGELAENARLNGLPLRDVLVAYRTSAMGESFKKGLILVSTSGSGQSASFKMPGAGDSWTQESAVELAQELIEIHDSLAATVDSSDLPVIQAAIADELRGIRTQMGDFSGLNFPATSLQ